MSIGFYVEIYGVLPDFPCQKIVSHIVRKSIWLHHVLLCGG